MPRMPSPSEEQRRNESSTSSSEDRLSASYEQNADLTPSGDQPAEQRMDWRLLLAAVDASNSLIVIADARQEDAPLIYVNQEFQRFTGYRPDEVLGQNCRFLQRRADGSMDRDQEDLPRLREAIKNGEHARVTLRNYKKDGTLFWNELFISPVFDHDDRLAYFIGVHNDVSELVETNQQLRESADTLSSLFDNAPVLMGVVERRAASEEDGAAPAIVHLRDNQTAADFFGTTPEAMRGKTDQELGFSDLCEGQWSRAYAESEETREPVHFECAYAPARQPGAGAAAGRETGGSSFNGDRSGTPAHDEGDEGALFERRLTVTVNFIGYTPQGAAQFSYLAEDVTERRQAEQERRLLEAAVEHADESLLITEARLDPPGPRFVYINPAFTRLTGYEREELAGKTPRILQGPETNRAELDRLRRILEAEGNFRGEATNYKKDGTPFVNEWHIAPIYGGDDGQVTHWVATQRDITQRRAAEEEVHRLNRDLEARVRERTAELEEKNQALQQAKEAAETAATSKTVFLANMSHEIRTPLTAILGFASLLVRRLPEAYRKFAERIEGAGGRLMETLNLVLELARLDTGEARIELEELYVVAEVQEIVELFRARAEAKGLELTFTATAEAREAQAQLDRGALSSILNNLIGNAIKFTDRGRIAVAVRLSAGPAPQHVEIEVADTGVGISTVFLPQLFEEFVQESTGEGRSHEGSGLGLAITKRLTQMMNGSVEVESTKDEGSVFTLRFPLAHAPEKQETTREEAATPAVAPEARGLARVLLVEDNEDTQYLIENLLEGMYDLTATSTPEGAMQALQQSGGAGPCFDLVLLDINLGSETNGVDVLRELRATPGYEAVPVVALTAYALPGDQERFEAMGFTAYLAKPFKFDALLTLVERLAV